MPDEGERPSTGGYVCGIVGIINTSDRQAPERAQIVSMMAPLRHRGPDESGVYLDAGAALGHLRLSIIGIDGGIQPMGNEEGDLWIVYNGEAFNYVELKQDLLAKGHRFRTQTDTEVLLHLYEEYGTNCLSRINGQFAFAIWDRRRKELFLARDRVGIRPLFYRRTGEGRFLFASEIKAMVALEGTRSIDPEALSQLFVFWTTLPGKTFFQGVRELPPGHYMLVGRRGEGEPVPYWRIPYVPREARSNLSVGEAGEALRELLSDAVRLRLRADVPVGAYLSGGLDSSIITSLVSRHCESHLKTFSLGFRVGSFDESPAQREMVRHLGSDNRHIMIENADIRRLLPDTVWHCEKPLLRTSPVPMFMLSGLVRAEGYKVVLSGEGADEILGGYNIFKEAKIRAYWGREPESLRRPLLLERLYSYVFQNPARGRLFLQGFFAVNREELGSPFFSHAIRWGAGEKNLALLSPEFRASLGEYRPLDDLSRLLPEDFGGRDLLSRAQVLEMEIFLSNFLLSSQGDRVGMAHSVEMRHPFLDYRVIEFAFGLPAKMKLKGLNEKYLLREAFRGVLPEAISRREKKPYRAPIGELFAQGAPEDYVDELLSKRSLKESGYFDPEKVERLYQRVRTAPPGGVGEFQYMALIGVLTTELLHRQFVAARRRSSPVQPNLVVRGDDLCPPQ